MIVSNVALLLWLAVTAYALPIGKPSGFTGRYGRLIVFGDSYSDNGNGAWTLTRLSNGPVWPTLLSNALGADLIDYATGGATADNSVVAGYTGPNSSLRVPSAHDQVARYLQMDRPRANDVFVHYIGANDPLFNTSVTGSEVSSIINADVDALYRAGAKHFLLANYPPVSTFPATYGEAPYPRIGPAYASSLDQGLSNIQAAWSAYVHVRIVHVQRLFADVVKQPQKYGVEASYVDPPVACLEGIYGTGERKLCTDPERHLFWDGYHPVAWVHERIAVLFEKALGA
ncbi:hypothetical protein N0V90_000924 [Kalmusia sp. IMI 367209]|nr:hypothetical protein N0V90_000924 [Kalmusia sp. IMI 367209]